MLARHAESLFWMGRYMERAEDTARMLDVTYHGLLESPPEEATRSWLDLLSVLNLDQVFAERNDEASAGHVSEFLVLDDKNAGSIVSPSDTARENARTVRELISTELWEALNTFCLELRARNLRADLEDQPYELYGLVKRRCQMVAGVAAETMARDDGWRFLDARLDARAGRDDVPAAERPLRRARGVTDLARLPPCSPGCSSRRRRPRRTAGRTARSMDPTRRRRVPAAVAHVPAQRPVLPAPSRARPCPPHRWRRAHPSRAHRRAHAVRASSSATSASSLPAACDGNLDRVQEGVRQVAEAVAAQYFRNLPSSISTRSSRSRRRAGAERCGSTSATAHGSATTTSSASRRTSCGPAPVSDDAPAAHLVSGHHDAGVPRVLVHRLLGHPCRRVRRARAPRGARGGRRGFGRDSADAAASPRRRTPTACRGEQFREEHLEYLLPTPHARLGRGRRRRGRAASSRPRARTS